MSTAAPMGIHAQLMGVWLYSEMVSPGRECGGAQHQTVREHQALCWVSAWRRRAGYPEVAAAEGDTSHCGDRHAAALLTAAALPGISIGFGQVAHMQLWTCTYPKSLQALLISTSVFINK